MKSSLTTEWGHSASRSIYDFACQLNSERTPGSTDFTRYLRDLFVWKYTSIPITLVRNWFLFLFCHFVWTKNKNNFLGNWWSGNEKYLLFVYSESHSTLKAYQIQETFTNGFSNMLLLFVYISVHISEATVVGLHIYQKKGHHRQYSAIHFSEKLFRGPFVKSCF